MSETKYFTKQELKAAGEEKESLILIHNSVYDVKQFLNEHPGGEEVLLEQAGKDATEAFEDVGHSSDAREMMTKYKVGELVESERTEEKKSDEKDEKGKYNVDDEAGSITAWIIPVALAIVATVLFRLYFFKV